jgi:prophage antirepressor-like protein
VLEIGAVDIVAMGWPGSNKVVRMASLGGRAWFVAADLCRALNFAMSSNGKPNVTEALKTIGAEERCFARLEVEPGSFKPYSRFALTSTAGVVEMVARKRRSTRVAILDEAGPHAWIAKAIAELAKGGDKEGRTTTSPQRRALP